MKAVGAVLRELWSLFVDDGSLAVALILWAAFCGLVVAPLPVAAVAKAAVLTFGVMAIFAENVWRAVRRR